MKRVLVTGGAGFIGSHLTESLLADGHFVRVVDNESTGHPNNLARVHGQERLEYIRGSVADSDVVKQSLADCDLVFHLAAAVGVALVNQDPIETMEQNIRPVSLLLRQLREESQQSGKKIPFLLASSSEVYGKNPKDRWTEQDELHFGPTTCMRWSYGMAKAIDEFLALAHHRHHQMPVVVTRFFNVVGPRQSGAYGMVLPRFVQAARQGLPLVVHDDGRQQRCFAHVSDVVAAIRELMETPQAVGGVFNVGTDEPVSIRQLAERVIARAGSSSCIEFQAYAAAYSADFQDVRRRVPDLTRLHATIQARPRYSLDAIIDELVA